MSGESIVNELTNHRVAILVQQAASAIREDLAGRAIGLVGDRTAFASEQASIIGGL
jgi:hypothetical protein